MSTAAAHLARLDRSIARAGDSVVLQRLAIDADGTTSVAAAATCPAFVRARSPQDLVESGAPDTDVVLSASSLGEFGLPVRDDRIVIRGAAANIIEVAPIYRGGELVRVNLVCRG